MQLSHHYKATIRWTGNTGKGTLSYRAYKRDYSISTGNKTDIQGSSDPKFLGDASKYNPEELLVASLSACHMLWYLHLCSEAGIIVMEYSDNATGEMAENRDGSGFFKELYRQQSSINDGFRSTTGSGAIFKSTSGWQDAKYYALMNNITPGTIVRVTNPLNSRTIFAKVLGELPPGKENEGLLIRISNAGAAELKVNEKESKFSAEVSYAKS